jgi:hypothetical protein
MTVGREAPEDKRRITFSCIKDLYCRQIERQLANTSFGVDDSFLDRGTAFRCSISLEHATVINEWGVIT